jgi:uncharacterized protein (TIGR02444 family)
MSNSFWDYSLASYRVDEVATTCLTLQDTYGVDVNLLLYAAWLAHINRRLSVDHLSEVDALVTQWRESVVKPLRHLRRQLRGYSHAEGVREELKALELRAEREQQDQMHAFYRRSAELPHEASPMRDNLTQVALLASPGNRVWEREITRLACLLSP